MAWVLQVAFLATPGSSVPVEGSLRRRSVVHGSRCVDPALVLVPAGAAPTSTSLPGGALQQCMEWSAIRDVLSSRRSKPEVCLEGFEWSIPVWEWQELQRHTVTSSTPETIEPSTSTPSRPEYSSSARTSSSSRPGYKVETTPSLSRPGKCKRPDEDH